MNQRARPRARGGTAFKSSKEASLEREVTRPWILADISLSLSRESGEGVRGVGGMRFLLIPPKRLLYDFLMIACLGFP
jgi:hypothetical protein